MTEQNLIKIQVKTTDNYKDLPLPTYATDNSAGMDLLAVIDEPIILKPMERALVPTGLLLALPNGYEAQVRPRSGLAFKNGITVLNTPGTIDADYRGEIKIILINLGQDDFVIERGMRVAQIIFAKVTQGDFMKVDVLDDTLRGAGGFGHSGV